MKKILLALLFLPFPFLSRAQLQMQPANDSRPSIISTYNNAPFSIGLVNTSVLHFTSNQNMGLGTRYISSSAEHFASLGKFHIRHNSSSTLSGSGGSAHLILDEAQFGDYARLRFINSFLLTASSTKSYIPTSRFWDIASKLDSGNDEAEDILNLYNSEGGNILTLRGDNKVGINDSSPERALDVNGTARVKGYTETGENSTPHKTKLISFTSPPISCSNNATYDFSLGIDENRILGLNVLVQNGSSAFHPPNYRFNNKEYNYYIDGTRIYFTFGGVSGCDFASRGFRVWLTYTDSPITSGFGAP